MYRCLVGTPELLMLPTCIAEVVNGVRWRKYNRMWRKVEEEARVERLE